MHALPPSGSPGSSPAGRLPRHSPARRLVAAAVALLVMAASRAGAQTARLTPDELDRLGLERTPLDVEALGLTMYPPAGSLMQQQRVGEVVTLTLVDGANPPVWSMRVQILSPTEAAASPEAQIDSVLDGWRKAGREHTVISSDPVTFGGYPGHLAYVRHAAENGEPVVSGWLVLDVDDDQHLAISMQLLPDDYSRLKILFDACFATLRLEPLTAVAKQRRDRLDAGRALLADLDPDRLRALADGQGRWYRYYLPAGAAGTEQDTELGYYRVEAREDRLGAIDPSKDEATYDPLEQTRGLLVCVQGHYLEAASNSTYDSQAFYWMAWDQSREAWSIRGTRRVGKREQSEALTGIRTPRSTSDPHGTLTVVSSGRDAASREQRSWRVPEVYLSQSLRWTLGRLLPREANAKPLEFSTYCFETGGQGELALSLRLDRWEPKADRSGRWTLSSRARSDAPEIVSVYDAAGMLLRRSWPTGQASEAMPLDALLKLWKSKGLETGEGDRGTKGQRAR